MSTQPLLASAAQQWQAGGAAVDAPEVGSDLVLGYLGLTYVCTQYRRAAGSWKWLQMQPENMVNKKEVSWLQAHKTVSQVSPGVIVG